jgi:urease subunit gamma/beta
VRLTPREHDRLLLHLAADLAEKRRERGLLLNAPEAIALIAEAICEAARDGCDHAAAVAAGRAAVGADQVLDGVPALVPAVEVEALFGDGTRLVVVEEPLGPPGGSAPGEVRTAAAQEEMAVSALEVDITNTAAVPIAITSHWHLFEANRALDFDRAAAWGMRLAIPTGSTIRWAPGETRRVPLRPFGGARIAFGFAGLVNGPLDEPGRREAALRLAAERGYRGIA